MTDNIEERLADALNATYDAAHALPLRPLTLAPPQPRRWLLLFAPIAAALAVIAVVTGVTTLTGRAGGPGATLPPPVAAGGKGLPGYYVDLNYNGQDVVRSVATGQVTATVPVPHGGAQGGAAASTSGHGEYFISARSSAGPRVYKFRLTSAGRVTGFAPVLINSVLSGGVTAMAITADGNKLALATDNNAGNTPGLIVVPLHGGFIRFFSGGLRRPGYQNFDISSLSWVGGDDNLAFTGLWCEYSLSGSHACLNSAQGTKQLTDIRELDATGQGSSLGSSKVLVSQSAQVPFIAAVAASPDGATLTAVVLSGPVKYTRPGTVPGHLAVRQFSTKTGQPGATLYQRATGPTDGWLLSPDPSGTRFLLAGAAAYYDGDGPPKLLDKGYNGYLSGGKLVSLPPSSGLLYGQAW